MYVYVDGTVRDLSINGMIASHKRSEDMRLRDLRKRVVRYFPELEKRKFRISKEIIEDYCLPGIEHEPWSFLVVTNDKKFIASCNPEVDMLMLKEVKDD